MGSQEARALVGKLQVNVPVHFVQGFFEATLPRVDVPPIAFLHLDVMLRKSYETCLTYLFPKVVSGGIVLLDEYDDEEHAKFPGPRKAVDAYFAGTGYRLQQDAPTGKWFVIKR
jgi:hypothetical protein